MLRGWGQPRCEAASGGEDAALGGLSTGKMPMIRLSSWLHLPSIFLGEVLDQIEIYQRFVTVVNLKAHNDRADSRRIGIGNRGRFPSAVFDAFQLALRGNRNVIRVGAAYPAGDHLVDRLRGGEFFFGLAPLAQESATGERDGGDQDGQDDQADDDLNQR